MDYELASNRDRFYSMGIDLFSVMILQLCLGGIVLLSYRLACGRLSVEADMEIESILSQVCGFLFFFAYFTFTVGLFGNTVGKKMMKLRTLKASTGRPLSLSQSYWRTWGYLMSSWTYMIGFILPWVRKDHKALHDLLCDTVVVRTGDATSAQLELPFDQVVIPFPDQSTEETPLSKSA